jgi:hypothetical protein
MLCHVQLPVTAVVSLFSAMKNGFTAKVAVVGSEGVVGVCAFMGGVCAQSGAVVHGAGHGLRMHMIWTQPPYSARPLWPRSAQLRVLRGHQTGLRPAVRDTDPVLG